MATFSYPNFSLAFNNVTVYTPNSWGMTNYVEIDNIPPDNIISVTASSGLVCITSTLAEIQNAVDNGQFRTSVTNFKTTTGSIFIMAMQQVTAEGATESINISLVIANNSYTASYTVACSNVKSQFKINKVTNATSGNDVTSNIITLTGLVAGDEIRAEGGYFNVSLNGGAFSINPVLIIGSSGTASVTLKSTYNNLVQYTGNSVSLAFYRNNLQVGQVSDYWILEATPVPNISDFTNFTDMPLSISCLNSIDVSNFTVGDVITITATGGEIKVDNSGWVSNLRVTVGSTGGFRIYANLIASSLENTSTEMVVKIGSSIEKRWRVTTITGSTSSTPPTISTTPTTPTTPTVVTNSSDNTKESFGFVDQNDVLTDFIATSNIINVTGFTVGKTLNISTVAQDATFSVSIDGVAWGPFSKFQSVDYHNGNVYLYAKLKSSASYSDFTMMNIVIVEEWGLGDVNTKSYPSRTWKVTTTNPASTGTTTGTGSQEITTYDSITTNHSATDLILVINSTTNVFGSEVFSPLQRLTGFLPFTPINFTCSGCEITIMPEAMDRTYSASLSNQANAYGNRFFRLRTSTPSVVSGLTSKTVTASYSFTDKNDNNYYKTGNITWNITLSTTATTGGTTPSVVPGTTPSVTLPTVTELTYSSNFILSVPSKNNVELNTEVLSDIVKIIGLPTSGQIKIISTGGEVSISSSSTSLSSNFKSDNTFSIAGDVYVQFRATSDSSYNKSKTVSIGFEITHGGTKATGSAIWVISTKNNSTTQTGDNNNNNNTPIFTIYEEPEIDREPEGLQFVDVVDAEASEVVESEQITMTDLTPDQWVQVHTGGVTTGGRKIKAATTVAGLASAPWVSQYNVKISSAGSIAIAAKITSSNSIGDTVSMSIFVGEAETTWNVTTATASSVSSQQSAQGNVAGQTGSSGSGSSGTVALSLSTAAPMVIPIRPFVGNELTVLKAQYASMVNNGGNYLTMYSTNIGKYLFSRDVLIEFGYLTAGATSFKMENWTAMNGFRNYRAFIAAGDFQEFLFDSLMAKRAAQLEAENIKISEMSVLSAAGLLMCAVRYGVPVVKTFASTLAGSNTGTGTGTGTSTSSESGEVTTTETKLAHGGSAIMDNNKCYITVIFQEISIDFTNSNSNVELFITNFDQVKTTSYNVDSGNKVFPKDAVTRHITIYACTIGTTTPLPIKVTYSDTTYSDTTHFVVTVINSEGVYSGN